MGPWRLRGGGVPSFSVFSGLLRAGVRRGGGKRPTGSSVRGLRPQPLRRERGEGDGTCGAAHAPLRAAEGGRGVRPSPSLIGGASGWAEVISGGGGGGTKLSRSPWGGVSRELLCLGRIRLRSYDSLFSQCPLELMRWMWTGLWKMTWAKAEKGLEQMMKLFKG